jgi:hypothetical protein
MTKAIRYRCPHCEKPLGPAEVVEEWCNRCERAAVPVVPGAPKAKVA